MSEVRKSEEFAVFLAGSDDPNEVAAAWQAYAKGSTEELAGDLQVARESLHGGTPAEVIAFGGIDEQARARAAASQFAKKEPTE
jgi:hypothetical protein